MNRNARILTIGATTRLLLAVTAAVVGFVLSVHAGALHTRLLIAWDTGTLLYLGLAGALIGRADAPATRDHVLDQDQNAFFIFMLVLIAACAALVAISFLVPTLKGLTVWPRAWHLALSIFALITSWILIQVVFTFHYARQYYGRVEQTDAPAGGLKFPGGEPPDYLDFAYYSFVVGMTSQVSDVVITARPMRHVTTAHGVLSFLFNMAILALSINIMASVLFQ